jgi:hypothetical protein
MADVFQISDEHPEPPPLTPGDLKDRRHVDCVHERRPIDFYDDTKALASRGGAHSPETLIKTCLTVTCELSEMKSKNPGNGSIVGRQGVQNVYIESSCK